MIFPVRDFANLSPGINRFFNLVDNADIDPPVCRLLFRYRLRPPPRHRRRLPYDDPANLIIYP